MTVWEHWVLVNCVKSWVASVLVHQILSLELAQCVTIHTLDLTVLAAKVICVWCVCVSVSVCKGILSYMQYNGKE